MKWTRGRTKWRFRPRLHSIDSSATAIPISPKQGLDRLAQQELGSLLAVIQRVLNEALFNEKRDVPEHVDHPPFHLDYIDAAESNAHAFNTEEYSFIGLTMGLIYDFGDLCVRLAVDFEFGVQELDWLTVT